MSMDNAFWLNRWEKNEGLGFNQSKPNFYLQKYVANLNISSSSCIFVPLCGKSIDMYWLYQQGYSILGLELSEIACRDFFIEHHLAFEKTVCSGFSAYQHPGVSLLVGDFFQLKAAHLQHVAAVYDRAALIALPQDMRKTYAKHMANILKLGTPMLLISFTCSEKKDGPPFSVSETEIHQLFSEYFNIQKLHDSPTDHYPNGSNQIYKLTRA